MSDTNNRPNKDGTLRGDDKAMPDRGTTTGMSPGADPYLDGRSVDQSAINRIGGISGATKSDPAGECYSPDPTFGERGGNGSDADDRT